MVEIQEQLRSLSPEMIVVVAYGKILPKEIIDMPVYGCVNIHASLLPLYRGAAPIQQSVLDGCTVTGVTAQCMDIGIDTVIDIRSGYRKFITYPSPYLLKKGCYMPSVDLIDMFCRLAQKYGMTFMLGLYDSGRYWDTGDMSYEVESNKYVIEEVWERYGKKYSSFGGWYISGEISRATKGAIESFRTMGRQCKEVSGGLPTFISPWIDGKKSVAANSSALSRADAVSVEEHEREWNEIFDGIHEYVDACAFQDGHIDYDELDAFFSVNKKLADRYGMKCWTNAESFDRDMPIKFFPIKFDKLRLKLEAAGRCGYDKAITFEFSHFMSPQSAYLQAGHLYDRYREYFGL